MSGAFCSPLFIIVVPLTDFIALNPVHQLVARGQMMRWILLKCFEDLLRPRHFITLNCMDTQQLRSYQFILLYFKLSN